MAETFDTIYYEEQRPSSGLAKYVDQARDRFIEKLILKRVQQGHLLDIGCGVGVFLERMSQYFDVSGTEISAAGISDAMQRVPAGSFQAGDIEEALPMPGPFAVITMINVLEHLSKPARAIANIAAGQVNGGLFVVHLPTIGNRLQRRIYEGSYDSDPTHIFRPSGAQVVEMVCTAGYRRISSSYAPFRPQWLMGAVPAHPAFLAVFERLDSATIPPHA